REAGGDGLPGPGGRLSRTAGAFGDVPHPQHRRAGRGRPEPRGRTKADRVPAFGRRRGDARPLRLGADPAPPRPSPAARPGPSGEPAADGGRLRRSCPGARGGGVVPREPVRPVSGLASFGPASMRKRARRLAGWSAVGALVFLPLAVLLAQSFRA